MDSDCPQLIDNDSRIVRFRPRLRGVDGRWPARVNESKPDDSPVADLAKFEGPESDDDYRHRMFMNAIALVFTTFLIVAGVWLASMMAHV
jgi:hypothetical protein